MNQKLEYHKSESATREHAEVGSSSAKGFLSCVDYCREQRPKPPHPVTVEGSLLHDALEERRYDHLDSFQLNLVNFCRDYYSRFGPYIREEQENRVYVLNEDWFGYFDRLAFKTEELAHMFDWKFGYVPVQDAEFNPQGWFLAIGVFDAYPKLQDLWVHFPQPRIGEIGRHKFNRKRDLPRLKQVFMSAIAERERYKRLGEPKEMLRPSFENCQYCGNKWKCQAILDTVQDTYRNLSEERKTKIQVPPDLDAKQVNDPAQLSAMRDLVTIQKEWADDANWHITQKRLNEGIEVPGYKMVDKRGVTTVLNVQAAWDLARKMGVPEEEIKACTSLSYSKLKKKVAEYAPDRLGTKAQKLFESDLLDVDAIKIGPDSVYLKREVT
jgi:hypothetical protein